MLSKVLEILPHVLHKHCLLLFRHQVMSSPVTPWTAALQASLSPTISRSLPTFTFIESVMPCNHLILCRISYCYYNYCYSSSPQIQLSKFMLQSFWIPYWHRKTSWLNISENVLPWRLRAGIMQLQPTDQICLPISNPRARSRPATAACLSIVYSCLCTRRAELRSSNWDHMAHKAKNINSPALYRKKLAESQAKVIFVQNNIIRLLKFKVHCFHAILKKLPRYPWPSLVPEIKAEPQITRQKSITASANHSQEFHPLYLLVTVKTALLVSPRSWTNCSSLLSSWNRYFKSLSALSHCLYWCVCVCVRWHACAACLAGFWECDFCSQEQ